jgi:hypothetical protein
MIETDVTVIRQAISREDYVRALELWTGYARDLREALDRGALTAEQMSEARSLFEWSRPVLHGARGYLLTQCVKARSAAAYLPPHPTSPLIRTSF